MGILMTTLLGGLLNMGIFAVIFFLIVLISGRITSGGIINSEYTLIMMLRQIKEVLVTMKPTIGAPNRPKGGMKKPEGPHIPVI